MNSKIIPNLFIVGYPKTGTTSIFDYLSEYAEICPAKIKEPGDWQELKNLNMSRAECVEYLKNFDGCKKEIYRMDGSTRYILHPDSAAAIKKISPKANLISAITQLVSRYETS